MKDPIRGRTLRWSYEDGPVKGKTFEHTFGEDGTVTWREVGAEVGGGEAGAKYEVATVTDDVYVVAYLAASGWTLTTVVDTRARRIVSFASNEKALVVQHGTLL